MYEPRIFSHGRICVDIMTLLNELINIVQANTSAETAFVYIYLCVSFTHDRAKLNDCRQHRVFGFRLDKFFPIR